ncbi:tyrosine-protein phosphatase [Fervidibacillus halotolerans]|uniref:Tyrosine-protein phosphatase n=1 Tax=Fervidibacillus halotolerans TaxID=2980027 RepID=A0A9E8RXS8_9BACI|nr:CpsB/CapC family capsule biosynthesis tyrosine phosphatase [Fervidibacillus halotolerans]WAA12121.1 tyrosine protein phosphatase [Fervidibacillus halotolerans]
MIDLHCHILPGVDDGAQTIVNSLEMAKEAVQMGIKKIVATPHHLTSAYENPKKEIISKLSELNEALHLERIPLEVLLGQEVRIFGEWLEEYEKGTIATINDSQYALIEFPSNHVPVYAERLFYDMQINGFIPIIAHPERNRQMIEQPEKLFQFVEKGVLAQLTAASITGAFGKKIQKFSQQLIEANLVHVIASDAHNTSTRSFKMDEAFDFVEKNYGLDTVYLFQENAEFIVNGQAVYRKRPKQVQRRRILGIF